MLGRISCEDLKFMMEHEPHSFVLIDVRNRDEWDAGHIESAHHIPLSHLDAEAEDVIPQYDTKVIVHCAGGSRGEKAGNILDTLGYKNVFNLDGGYRGYCEL